MNEINARARLDTGSHFSWHMPNSATDLLRRWLHRIHGVHVGISSV